jgi:hypothetical protein
LPEPVAPKTARWRARVSVERTSGPRRASAIAIPDAPPTRGANRAAIVRDRAPTRQSAGRAGPQRAEKLGVRRQRGRSGLRAFADGPYERLRSGAQRVGCADELPQQRRPGRRLHAGGFEGDGRAVHAGRLIGRARRRWFRWPRIGRLAEEESIDDRRDKEPADRPPDALFVGIVCRTGHQPDAKHYLCAGAA